MNNHLDDILGIDAQGVSEIKAILSDDDTTTGLIKELANINARLNILESYWRLNTTTNRLETSYVIEPEGYR